MPTLFKLQSQDGLKQFDTEFVLDGTCKRWCESDYPDLTGAQAELNCFVAELQYNVYIISGEMSFRILNIYKNICTLSVCAYI